MKVIGETQAATAVSAMASQRRRSISQEGPESILFLGSIFGLDLHQ